MIRVGPSTVPEPTVLDFGTPTGVPVIVGLLIAGLLIVGLVNVLFVSVCVASRVVTVPLDDGNVNVVKSVPISASDASE